jgi:hypothetical protein
VRQELCERSAREFGGRARLEVFGAAIDMMKAGAACEAVSEEEAC